MNSPAMNQALTTWKPTKDPSVVQPMPRDEAPEPRAAASGARRPLTNPALPLIHFDMSSIPDPPPSPPFVESASLHAAERSAFTGAIAANDGLHSRIAGVLPTYDVQVVRELVLPFDRQSVYEGLKAIESNRMPMSKAFARVSVGGETPFIEALVANAWCLLVDANGREVVLGAAGGFGGAGGTLQALAGAVAFAKLAESGLDRAALSFRLDDVPQGTRVRVELRIKSSDERRVRCRRHWKFARYPAQLAMRWALKSIRSKAEAVVERALLPSPKR